MPGIKTLNFVTRICCAIILFSACHEARNDKPAIKDSAGEFVSAATTVNYGNSSTTISEDTVLLGKLINLQQYKPNQVKFLYSFINNSGKNSRTVPGPSDFQLQAILYFDSLTFNALTEAYSKADWVSPGYQQQEFNFSWLDNSIKQELQLSDTIYHGHTDLFFTSPNSSNCHLWMLDKKLLLRWFSM